MGQVQKNEATSPFPKPKHEECLSVSQCDLQALCETSSKTILENENNFFYIYSEVHGHMNECMHANIYLCIYVCIYYREKLKQRAKYRG